MVSPMTVMPKTPEDNTESLREALLDLERSKQIEQETRIESEYILICLNALARVGLHSNALPILLEELKPVFEYEQAFVLVANPKDLDHFTVTASTDPCFHQSRWSSEWLSSKVSVRKPLIAFNIRTVPVWQQQDPTIQQRVNSALHIALRPLPRPAYLICTHSQIGFFDHKHSRRAIRFAPMAAQALLNIESTEELSKINQRLKQEVEERRKTQQELVEVQAKLIATARQAGKAEIATNVVHNIGNVLNSVNIGSTELKKQLDSMPLKYLSRMAEMVSEHQDLLDGHEKMKLLPSVIEKLTNNLERQHQACSDELSKLQSHVEHIAHIVKLQQESAGYQAVLETVNLADVINSAITINFGRQDEIETIVVKNYESSISCRLDKHKLLQILVNLLSNAKHAIAHLPTHEQQIELGLEVMDDVAYFRVKDNGEGIVSEEMEKIFGHGYSNRPEGHGFGLHASALNATQLGGQLKAHSPGRDQGAEFVLSIPLK